MGFSIINHLFWGISIAIETTNTNSGGHFPRHELLQSLVDLLGRAARSTSTMPGAADRDCQAAVPGREASKLMGQLTGEWYGIQRGDAWKLIHNY